MNKTYQQIIEQFFFSEQIRDYTLEKINKACEHFGNPQESFKSIHIAGTNGKGSTSKMIFQILKESGKKVGVYTSPHNTDIRERFETHEGLISQSDFVRLAEQIIEYGSDLSYYEKCVFLAFLYFKERGCEYGVIEVGMGGRLDATNIITPILSIITSISYDHMEFLGYTLEAIAREKGGIIKSGVPVILYDKNPTLELIAYEQKSRIIFPEKRPIETNLLGNHQISNGSIAYEAGKFLGISDNIIKQALLDVEHHGRLEYIRPNVLIDGAHNEDGLRKLREYISSLNKANSEIIYCINLKVGKPIELITSHFPGVSEWVVVDSEHQMVEDAEIIQKKLQTVTHSVSSIKTPKEILQYAKKHPEKLFVVFGSLYMIGEFLRDCAIN